MPSPWWGSARKLGTDPPLAVAGGGLGTLSVRGVGLLLEPSFLNIMKDLFSRETPEANADTVPAVVLFLFDVWLLLRGSSVDMPL